MLSSLKFKIDEKLYKLTLNLAKLGLTPTHLTIFGLISIITSSIFLYFKLLFLTIILLALGGFFDMLDGALARNFKKETLKGAILDSTFDRYSDFFPLFFIGLSELADWLIVAFAIFGSLIPSFVKARIEAEYFKEKKEIKFKYVIGERSERLLILILCLIIYPFFNLSLTIGLVVIGIIGNIAALIRLYYIFKD